MKNKKLIIWSAVVLIVAGLVYWFCFNDPEPAEVPDPKMETVDNRDSLTVAREQEENQSNMDFSEFASCGDEEETSPQE